MSSRDRKDNLNNTPLHCVQKLKSPINTKIKLNLTKNYFAIFNIIVSEIYIYLLLNLTPKISQNQ